MDLCEDSEERMQPLHCRSREKSSQRRQERLAEQMLTLQSGNNEFDSLFYGCGFGIAVWQWTCGH